MIGAFPDLRYDFTEVSLKFIDDLYQDVFARKNNKTVSETLQHQRYKQFEKDVKERYPNILEEPLGKALLRLKEGLINSTDCVKTRRQPGGSW